MKLLLKPAIAIGLAAAAAAPLAVAPAAAQNAQSIGVVNLPAVIANSNAFKIAEQQRPVTYKPQLDAAEARRVAIGAQLQPLVEKFNTDRAAANPNQQALQTQAAQIQQIEQNGQRELQQILAPVALSRAYVNEQIEDQLDEAVQAAATKKGVTLLLDASQGQVIFASAERNMTQAVLDELNTWLPNAMLVPPTGWGPREIRQQQEAAAAAQAAQAGQAAPAAAPATGAQPTGR